ncbi:MAG: hypothetical protein JNJ70_26100 [Verrucomicrobiales bacterium]|nr:hypothetical protein [Verrucomicrobiales bacterium]
MTEEESISEMTAILEQYGFTVERIPARRDVRRPDVAVRLGDELYLVEQKSKGDDPDERARDSEALQNTKIIDRAKPLRPRGVLSGILEDALEQIEAHPDAANAFKIVWMTVWGVWRDANALSLTKGVYGLRHVFDVDDHGGEMQDCYYLGFSDFERFSEIDAVVIMDGESLRILVNEFSPRYQRFVQSQFAERFRQAVRDPREHVAAGNAYSLRGWDGDHRDIRAGLDELASRLGVRRMETMDMSEFHVVANLDRFLADSHGNDTAE